MYDRGNWGIEVFLAMSEEQAETDGCYRCMAKELPESDEIYHLIDEIPEEMCVSRTLGWKKEICIQKTDFIRLMGRWGIELLPDYVLFLHYVKGDYIWLIGFGG